MTPTGDYSKIKDQRLLEFCAGVLVLYRFFLSIALFLLPTIGLSEPTKNEISEYLRGLIDSTRHRVETVKFQNFRGEAGTGRTSVAGTLTRNLPVYLQTDGSSAKRYLETKGLTPSQIDSAIGSVLRTGAFSEWALVGQPGSVIEFEAELTYRETVNGYSFGGRITKLNETGKLARNFAPGSHIVDSLEWVEYLDRAFLRVSQESQQANTAIEKRRQLLKETKDFLLGLDSDVYFGNSNGREKEFSVSCPYSFDTFGRAEDLGPFAKGNVFGFSVVCAVMFTSPTFLGVINYDANQITELTFVVEIGGTTTPYAELYLASPYFLQQQNQFVKDRYLWTWENGTFSRVPSAPYSGYFFSSKSDSGETVQLDEGLELTAQMADGPENKIFNAVKILHQSAQEKSGSEKLKHYQGIRRLLNQIVDDYPSSELAVRILLMETIDGVDIVEVDQLLATNSAKGSETVEGSNEPKHDHGSAEVEADSHNSNGDAVVNTPQSDDQLALIVPQPPSQFPKLPEATLETERSLGLQKKDVRDIQARLLTLGYDPNGVDGVIGKGTRRAISAWQLDMGVSDSGYLNTEQLQSLKQSSNETLADWLQDPKNQAVYDPPPPIAVGPRSVSGRWRFTTNCGSKSRLGKTKITGVLDVVHAGGNRYTGKVQQSQGYIGRFSGQLSGRTMNAEINWGLLLGRIQVRGRIADQKLVMSGTDSNRCSFYAAKS